MLNPRSSSRSMSSATVVSFTRCAPARRRWNLNTRNRRTSWAATATTMFASFNKMETSLGGHPVG